MSLLSPYPEALLERIRYLAQFKQRPVTLQQLFEFGSTPSDENLLRESQFMHQELPVRLAHRVQELEGLPFGLSEMPSVRLVKGMYIDSIRDLVESPRPDTLEADHTFTETLEAIKGRHNNVVPFMARGILEWKRSRGESIHTEIYDFLDRFYMSRIGIRMLIGQHIALRERPRPGYVGLIGEKCSPAEVARAAMFHARERCRTRYMVAPEVGVFGSVHLTFTYVPTHLQHMLFELLKNSMRAVVEFHSTKSVRSLPLIRVVIAEGQEDVTIKIADEGGGIPRSGMPKIWTYLYSTAEPPPLETIGSYDGDFQAPMAGLGYGLPLTRLYARYFGGDLQMLSMEGYGTDAYLHLTRLGDVHEVLPRKLF